MNAQTATIKPSASQLVSNSSEWDVFVSYSRKNKTWVRRFVKRMRSNGLRVFYDEDCVRAGQELIKAIEDGLTRSRYILLVISASSIQSGWVSLEIALTLYADLDGTASKLIPLMLDKIDEKKLRPAIRRLNFLDLTRPRGRNETLDRFISNLKMGLNEEANDRKVDSMVSKADRLGTRSSQNGDLTVALPSAATEVGLDANSRTIELIINRNFDSFGPAEERKLVAAIRSLLSVTGDLRIVNKRPGSVKLTIKMSPDDARKLISAVENGHEGLAQLGVVRVEAPRKKTVPVYEGFEWAGAVARVRRGVHSSRSGRRTALLSMLTAAYVNSSRSARNSDRSGSER